MRSKATTLLLVLLLSAAVCADINIGGNDEGRTFDGAGALSAGASSRLLIDYPEPYRSQILDYLFEPHYGAALQHLKVELGSGGVNSTCGTEPSHALTRNEFDNPKPEYYDRGYEWWLMEQAKARNPDIYLDCLEWGAPEWIGDGQYYSQDNADYIVKFIQGAYDYHGLIIDYVGIWNERMYDAAWIKLLRDTLDNSGLGDVKIVAADLYDPEWALVDDMEADQDLKDAIYAVGVHYPSWWGHSSSQAAKDCGRPLWDSEDWNSSGNWAGALYLARILNKNYIIGKMTKTEVWSPVTSYPDNVPWARSGLMLAQTPWSGHYQVQPAIWAMAHTTQFAQPGWKYIDSGCGLLEGGSYVTLKKPDDSGDYSIIIETSESTEQQTLVFNLSGGLSIDPVHVWRTNTNDYFVQVGDITPVGGSFNITLDGQSIYSLTTTTGQYKGATPPPPAGEFSLPYADDFESYDLYKQPKYFCDQGGTFEIADRTTGQGQCLRQATPEKGIQWGDTPCPETIIGSTTGWSDFEVSSDVFIEDSGYVAIMGRFCTYRGGSDPPDAYWLKVDQDGNWEFKIYQDTVYSGTVTFAANTWHNLRLQLGGSHIIALIDDVEVVNFFDMPVPGYCGPTYSSGMAGLGTGWNTAQFDNFSIQPFESPAGQCANLALDKSASASTQWSQDYSADKANDGSAITRWSSAGDDTAGAWLEIDFGENTAFDTTALKEYGSSITGYKIQYRDGLVWRDLCTDESIGELKVNAFSPVTANRIRLYITATNGGASSVYEFEVYFQTNHDSLVSNPSPPDEAEVHPSVNTLSWINPTGTSACDVWFGTDPQTDFSKIVDHQLTESVLIELDQLETYYWKVDCYDSQDQRTEGVLISFNTMFANLLVDAGQDQQVYLTDGTVTTTLAGQLVEDDGEPVPATVLWSVLSEPDPAASPAIFSPEPPDVLAPNITMTATGEYILQLEADDTAYTHSDTVNIAVYADACEHAQNQPGFDWLAGDIDYDCDVDLEDLAVMVDDWLDCYSSNCP